MSDNDDTWEQYTLTFNDVGANKIEDEYALTFDDYLGGMHVKTSDLLTKWDKRYLDMACMTSAWSKDPRTQIGAVIVGNNREILSQGYNGFPRGVRDNAERYDDRVTKHRYVVHAELNAILNAARNGTSVAGCTLYINGLPPCNECAKAIIQSGIKRVVSRIEGEPDDKWMLAWEASRQMFDEAQISYIIVDQYNEILYN